jgi:UDP-2,3-diacylglucosamine pyrophosphatase LpxH
MTMSNKKLYRSIFISDIHLGSPACEVEALLIFLDSVKSEYLYIVGDFIDFYHLFEHHGWAAECNLVIRKIFSKVRKGTKVRLCIGNHDAFIGILSGFKLGDIEVGHRFIHQNEFINYLVIHGDYFDKGMRHVNLAKIMSFMYTHFHSIGIARYLKKICDKVSARHIDYNLMKEISIKY